MDARKDHHFWDTQNLPKKAEFALHRSGYPTPPKVRYPNYCNAFPPNFDNAALFSFWKDDSKKNSGLAQNENILSILANISLAIHDNIIIVRYRRHPDKYDWLQLTSVIVSIKFEQRKLKACFNTIHSLPWQHIARKKIWWQIYHRS